MLSKELITKTKRIEITIGNKIDTLFYKLSLVLINESINNKLILNLSSFWDREKISIYSDSKLNISKFQKIKK
jgi:hypothetical protein